MEIKEYRNFIQVEIVNLYKSVGWINYVALQGMLEMAYEILSVYNHDNWLE